MKNMKNIQNMKNIGLRLNLFTHLTLKIQNDNNNYAVYSINFTNKINDNQVHIFNDLIFC